MKTQLFSNVLKVFLLLSSTLMLMTCGGGHGRGSTPPPPLVMTVGSPLADTVARSTFNAYSAVVSPGALYKISIADQTDDTDLLVFGTDSSFTTLVKCAIDNTSINSRSSPEDCVIVAPSSTLYFGVDGTFIRAGAATYTIDIELLTATNLTLSTPLFDSTTQKKAAIYTVTVSPGVAYTVSMSGLSDDVDLHVFGNDNTFTTPATCSPNNTLYIGTTPEDCTWTSSAGTLYFIVDGIFSSTAVSQYTVLATRAPIIPIPTNEGTIGSPIALTVDTPTTGQVAFNGTSYYAVGGLTAGTRYTVSTVGLTADANLKVNDSDSTYTSPASCLHDNTFFLGTTPEDCTLVASGSTLYFTIAAKTTSGGVAFINLVEPGP